MATTIHIKMIDKEVEIDLTSNVLTQSTIKSQFLLPCDAVVSLSYEVNGRRKGCQMNDAGTAFLIPSNLEEMHFLVDSNKMPLQSATQLGQTIDVGPVSLEGSASRKRQRIDLEQEPPPVDGDIVFRIRQYAWFYTKGDNLKRSAIPVTRYLAITYRHGENKHLVNGDCVRLSSYQNQEVIVDSYVVLIDDFLDLIVLQSKSTELCNRDLILVAAEPKRGMPYILMGYSVVHGRTSHISFSTGIISSDITSSLRFLGSSGSFKGDSGGSCWSDDGRLIGMQVETEKIPHTTDKKNGRPASPASGGRCEIIPITKIHHVILKFLPPEEDVDWNE